MAMRYAHSGCEAQQHVRDPYTWDWFTGYLPATACWCPEHKDSDERHVAFLRSRKDPTSPAGEPRKS